MYVIHYHVRNEARIVKQAVYIAIGIGMDGHKDVLRMYVGEDESAKFWHSIMNGLRNRGAEDILIACGWTIWFSPRDRSRISQNRSAAMHHSSDP